MAGAAQGLVNPLQPGQQPTPQQMQAIQQQFTAEAAKQGLTPQQLAEKMRAQMQEQMKAQQQQQQQQEQQGQQNQSQQKSPQQMPQQQQVPIQPGPPKPEALAVAKFLKSQELKSRPCVLQEKRREMFKVKRAIRALQSPAYVTARTKNPVLPEVTDRASAENAFKLLPLSMLAIRVTRIESDKPQKKQMGPSGVKKPPVWNVKVEPQQDAQDQFHYVWFYEGAQWRTKLYAIAALAGIMAVVLFPLWPFWARKGVWYISMGCLGLVGAFFGLAIVRLILYVITYTLGPSPGIWLYPNLFADVGFFDSFRPVWDWRETKASLAQKKAEKKAEKKARKEKKAKKGAKKDNVGAVGGGGAAVQSAPAEGTGREGKKEASATGVQTGAGVAERRNMSAKVEDADDE